MRILENFILHVTTILSVDLTTKVGLRLWHLGTVGLRLWHLDYVLNDVLLRLWHLVLESLADLRWRKRKRWPPVDSVEEFLWYRRQSVCEVLNLLASGSHQALSLLVLIDKVLLNFLSETWLLGNRARPVELLHMMLGHDELGSQLWHDELRS